MQVWKVGSDAHEMDSFEAMLASIVDEVRMPPCRCCVCDCPDPRSLGAQGLLRCELSQPTLSMVGALALAPPPALHGGQRLLGVGAGADVVLLTLPAGVQPAYSAEPVEEQETTKPREADRSGFKLGDAPPPTEGTHGAGEPVEIEPGTRDGALFLF